MQAIKRVRKLSIDEYRQVIELIERSSDLEERVYVGAYLLLDQQDAAQMHFARMDSLEQEHLLRYPIRRFFSSAM